MPKGWVFLDPFKILVSAMEISQHYALAGGQGAMCPSYWTKLNNVSCSRPALPSAS